MAMTDETRARRKIMRMADNFVHLSEKLAALMLREGVAAFESDQGTVHVNRDRRGVDIAVFTARDPAFFERLRKETAAFVKIALEGSPK